MRAADLVENDVTDEELRMIAMMDEQDRLQCRIEELKKLQFEIDISDVDVNPRPLFERMQELTAKEKARDAEIATLTERLDALRHDTQIPTVVDFSQYAPISPANIALDKALRNQHILSSIPMVAGLNDNNRPLEELYARRIYKRKTLDRCVGFTYEPHIAGFDMENLHPTGPVICQKLDDTLTIRGDLLLKLNSNHSLQASDLSRGDFSLVILDTETCPNGISQQSLAQPVPVTYTGDNRGEDTTAHQLFATLAYSPHKDHYYMYFYYKIEDAIYDVDRLLLSDVINVGINKQGLSFAMLSFNFAVVLESQLDEL